MILPPKPLSAVLAQEILPPRVHHQVSPHIFPGVEAPVTVVARMLLFLRPARSPSRMSFEVLQQDLGTFERLEAYLAAEVTAGSRVHGQVSPETQLGVVVLATLGTVEGLLVGIVGLQVVAKVIFPVKHLLAVHALMRLLSRVSGHMPIQLVLRSKGFATVQLGTVVRSLLGMRKRVSSQLVHVSEGAL